MDSSTWLFIAIIIIPVIALFIVAWKLRRISQIKKAGFPIQDERSQMINRQAATYAFYLGTYFMVALLLLNIIGQELFDLPEYSASSLLIVLIMMFNISFGLFHIYLNRKRDIE